MSSLRGHHQRHYLRRLCTLMLILWSITLTSCRPYDPYERAHTVPLAVFSLNHTGVVATVRFVQPYCADWFILTQWPQTNSLYSTSYVKLDRDIDGALVKLWLALTNNPDDGMSYLVNVRYVWPDYIALIDPRNEPPRLEPGAVYDLTVEVLKLIQTPRPVVLQMPCIGAPVVVLTTSCPVAEYTYDGTDMFEFVRYETYEER